MSQVHCTQPMQLVHYTTLEHILQPKVANAATVTGTQAGLYVLNPLERYVFRWMDERMQLLLLTAGGVGNEYASER